MKGSDKAIVLGVVMAVVLAGFYMKVLSPKREKATSLSKEVTELQANVDTQKQTAEFAEDARRHFPTYYGRLVVLGKAVPGDADTPSLLVEVNSVANRTGVKFNSLQLSAASDASSSTSTTTSTSSAPPATDPSAGGAPATDSSAATGTTSAPGTAPTSGTAPSSGTTPTAGTAPTTTTTAATTAPAPATEATAANLPLGASVGAAGLPTMPYDMSFEGSYFQVADFLKGVDDLVHMRGSSQVAADGRLLTIDGFSLSPAPDSDPSNPTLTVKLAVTSYVTPSDQGLTVGASPTGPSPSLTQPEVQPTSATVAP
jgi:Tfp pilus assembly protein PilO